MKPLKIRKKKLSRQPYRVNPKLSKETKNQIWNEYKKGGGTSKFQTDKKVSIHTLMERYNASYGTIWNIINGNEPKVSIKKKKHGK